MVKSVLRSNVDLHAMRANGERVAGLCRANKP